MTNSMEGPYTDSISLEYSEESSDGNDDRLTWTHTGAATSESHFHQEINKLKAASTKKFQDKWEAILEKYAKIDDNVESDEIDLATGNIIVDNGHLRSLRTHVYNGDGVKVNGNVWAPDYDAEKDEQNARRRERRQRDKKSMLREKLKAEHHFHVENINRRPSPVRKKSPDNILLLDPSPTKKQRISPTKERSSEPMSVVDRGSPRMSVSDSESEITTLKPLPEAGLNFDNSSAEDSRTDVDSEDEVSDSQEESLIQAPWLSNAVNKLEVEDAVSSEDESVAHDSDISILPASQEVGLKRTLLAASTDSDTDVTPVAGPMMAQEEIQEANASEEEYSIVLDTQSYIPSDKRSIFSCCFENCYYTTGNKTIFERHVLEKHRTELYIIGYPIDSEEVDKSKKPKITRLMIQSLTNHFPLVHEAPGLPLSGNGQMFQCNLDLGGKGKCKRTFLTKNELNHHQDNYPFRCSSKTQVYVCPLLGCGFMTDAGYFSYRDHFITQKHYLEPEPRGQVIETTEEEVSSSPISDSDHSTEKSTPAGEQSPPFKLHSPIKLSFDKASDIPYSSTPTKSSKITQELDDLFNSDSESCNDNTTQRANDFSTPTINMP